MGHKKKETPAGFVFFLYCVTMLWLLLGQRLGLDGAEDLSGQLQNHLNLKPFHTILWFIHLPRITSDPYLLTHALVNLAGNVLLFVPLGYLLPQAVPRVNRLWKLVFWVTVSVVLVEILQLMTLLGSCDVDDLILNLLGAVIGYGIWRFRTK